MLRISSLRLVAEYCHVKIQLLKQVWHPHLHMPMLGSLLTEFYKNIICFVYVKRYNISKWEFVFFVTERRNICLLR